MKISLITYTYNDHKFVRDLLLESSLWGVRLHEAIVVDDASDMPFPFNEDIGCPVKVVRLKENVGPGMVKHYGIEAASGDILFLVAADIRPDNKWLGYALSLLTQKDIGVVGGTIYPKLGKSYFSKANFRTFSHDGKDVQEVLYLAGGILLFSRTVWDFIRGTNDYLQAGWQYEDSYLSTIITSAGLKLIQLERYPVYEVRELHRTAWCRRYVRYSHSVEGNAIAKFGVEKYFDDTHKYWEKAEEYFYKNNDPILLYVELLKIVSLLAEVGKRHDVPFSSDDIIAGGLWELLHAKKTQTLMQDDLFTLGECYFGEVREFSPFKAFRKTLTLALPALENEWVERYRHEDKTLALDDHYMKNNELDD